MNIGDDTTPSRNERRDIEKFQSSGRIDVEIEDGLSSSSNTSSNSFMSQKKTLGASLK